MRYWLRLGPGTGRGIAVYAGGGRPGPPSVSHDTGTVYLDELSASFDIVEPTIASLPLPPPTSRSGRR